jgi:hypothetical protein
MTEEDKNQQVRSEILKKHLSKAGINITSLQTFEHIENAMEEYKQFNLPPMSTSDSNEKPTISVNSQDPAWSVNQWISVEDRLPTQDDDIVLVYDAVGNIYMGYLHGLKSGFITYADEAYQNVGEITHWMPLPQVPPSILNNVYISEVKR